MRALRDITDGQVQQAAAVLIQQLMRFGTVNGYPPEYTWMVLALAAEGSERAIAYTIGVMKEAGVAEEYAQAQERLKQLLEAAKVQHQQTADATDLALSVDRGKPS